VNPKNIETLTDLGTAYGIKGDVQNSVKYSLLGLEIKPNDSSLLMNVGIGYQRLNNPALAKKFPDRAVKINPALRR